MFKRYTDKTSENKRQAVAGSLPPLRSSHQPAVAFEDNRPAAAVQRALQKAADENVKKITSDGRAAARRPAEILQPVAETEESAGSAAVASGPGVIAGMPDEVLDTLLEEANQGGVPAAPFPSHIPGIADWDREESYHRASDEALAPFHQRWASAAVPPGIGAPIRMEEAIGHLAQEKRFYSHELSRAHLPFAIAQGGVQSGSRTKKALHIPVGRDKGKAQNNFVFTRQLPPVKVKSTLKDGQVGAKADAMVIFKPSMLEEPDQLALFKGMDGGFKSHLAPTREYKAAHIKSKSDEIEQNSDTIYQANQEQAVLGSISLRHIAMIVLKENTRDPEKLRASERNFIRRLKATLVTSQLPPMDVRMMIARDPLKYEAWKHKKTDRTLYDVLKESTNREPEDMIKAVFLGTKRADLRESADRIVKLPPIPSTGT